MRDLLLATVLVGALPFIAWRPTIGIFMWVWVSVMNPHRLAWGFMYDWPIAQMIAIATLVGIVFSSEPKRVPVTPVTTTLFALVVWMNITTMFGFDPDLSLPMWEKVMKIQFMVFVALFVLHTKAQINGLIWVLAGSVAFFGLKGGIFTILTGGEHRVWGPPASFIEENNSLALATIMTIPLLRYLHLEAQTRWLRWGLMASIVLCIFSALGSHSRGGFLAIAAMLVILWLKSPRRLLSGIAFVILIPVAIGFMPDKWEDRMRTIETYQEDASAMGRINSWLMAFNLAKDRPLIGGGFEIYNASVFGRYAPDPTIVKSAHSIYFQMLGEHGFVGLGLFLLVWLLVWRDASWIIRAVRDRAELLWAANLARMIQVSLAGYAVGGAFLNLAYYDVPYNLLVALVAARVLIARELSEAASAPAGGPAPGIAAQSPGSPAGLPAGRGG